MMHFLRKRARAIARLMLAVVGGVWLTAAAAPCVMAEPCLPHSDRLAVPCHESPDTPSDHRPDCPATGAIDCQLPQPKNPTAFELDDHLLTLPAAVAPRLDRLPPASRALLAGSRATRDIPAPPLYLRHLTLLI